MCNYVVVLESGSFVAEACVSTERRCLEFVGSSHALVDNTVLRPSFYNRHPQERENAHSVRVCLSPMLSLAATLRHAPVFNGFRAWGGATTAGHPPRIIAAVISQRGYASETTSPPQGSFKPKAHTPLRRTASDSLSIRANPKPTQSEIKPIFTLATSDRYLLTRLRTRLPPTARPLHDAYCVPKWSGGEHREGEVFIFSNGSFVCWGLSEDDAMRFRRDVLAPAGAEVKPIAEPEIEELEFATDPSECVAFVFFSCYEL
jgi:hypothetical protein